MEIFDPSQVGFAGVEAIIVIFGLVQFLKELLNLDGKAVTVLSAILGAILMTLIQLSTILPQPFGLVLEILIKSLTFGLAASGYYKFARDRIETIKK